MTERCVGVHRRAKTVHREYVAKAIKTDRKYNNTPRGEKGPLQSRLEEYGEIQALVIGPRGEASKHVHGLVHSLAEIAAEKTWKEMGATSITLARDVWEYKMVRQLGILCVRENAKLIRERLAMQFGDWASAASRRTAAERNQRTMADEYAARFCEGDEGKTRTRHQ